MDAAAGMVAGMVCSASVASPVTNIAGVFQIQIVPIEIALTGSNKFIVCPYVVQRNL